MVEWEALILLHTDQVEWVIGWVDDGGQLLDDGGWEAGWVDDGGWVGCVGFLREMIV